jgi:protein required for attachment to host cells
MDTAAWLCVIDEEAARLIRVTGTGGGRPQAAEAERLANAWTPHEHGRPSSRTGRSGHTYASQGHEEETMMTRYAHDVASWLDRSVERQQVERIIVFAAPRLMGALRKSWTARLAPRVLEQTIDLGGLQPGKLTRHPAVTTALEAAQTR